MSDELDELLQAAVSAGSAVELLAKAYLLSVESALLAEKGDRDTVLLLSGNSRLAKQGVLSMRTIGAIDALRLVAQLHKAFPPFDQHPPVLRARNSASHLALVDPAELRDAVVQMSQMVVSLLRVLGLDQKKFWGEHSAPVVEALLDEAKTRVEQSVAAKVAAAQARLERLTAGLFGSRLAAVLTAMSSRKYVYADHEERQECPVCKQTGWLICSVEEGDVEAEDEHGNLERFAVPVAYPFEFDCPVCELQLDVDEIAEFDFPRSIEVQSEDADWEPDES